MKFKKLMSLFFDYFKIGLFTFGGGYAMISLIQKTFVEKRKYIDDEELLNIISIAESTPGVMAVNSATYIGHKVLGFLGSLFATIGVCLPSFIIILLISFFYDKFIEIKWINAIISGLMVAVTFLIFRAAIKLFQSAQKDYISYIFMGLSFIALLCIKIFKLNFSTIYIILISVVISLIIFLIKYLKMKKKTNNEEELKEEVNEE